MDAITPSQLVEMMMVRAATLDEAQKDFEACLQQEAYHEREYRKAKMQFWVEAPVSNVSEREAWVNGKSAEHRFLRDLAQGKSKAALEKIRNVRQQLSALQSAANAIKEEAAYERVGPPIG